jgi:hypothetical protein
VAAFKAEEKRLPAALRAWPACADLEQRFGHLDERACPERLPCRQSKGLAALRRLLRLPAPDSLS